MTIQVTVQDRSSITVVPSGTVVQTELKSFPTRADFAAEIARGTTWSNGTVISAGRLKYLAMSDSGNPLADLPGFVPDGEIFAEHFGAVGDNATDCTAAFQSAVDYVSGFGTVVLNKAGIGGIVCVGAGAFRISDAITITTSGIKFVGRGPGITAIRQMDETKDGFVLRANDPMNDPTALVPNYLGIRDLLLYVDGAEQSDSLSGIGIRVQRAKFEIFNVNIRGFRTNFDIRGAAEGSRIVDCASLGQRSPNVTIQSTEDAHLYVGAEEVSNSSIGHASNGSYWDGCVGLYVDNFQAKDPTTIKISDCLKVGAVDGLYANNCHFGFSKNANIKIQSQSNRLTCQNIIVDGCFLDLNPETSWGIEITEGPGWETVANNIIFSDLRGNIGYLGFARLAAARTSNVRFDGFSLNTNGDNPSGIIGFDIYDGNDIVVTNGNISSCPGGYYVRVRTIAGVDRVTVSNIHARDYGNMGPAAAGIFVDRGESGLIFENLRLYDTGGNPIQIDTVEGSERDYVVDNILSDGGQVIVAAATIPAYEWTDILAVSGNTQIDGFQTSGAHRGQRNGRMLTLVFDDALTVGTAGNIKLSAPYSSGAGGSLTLRHHQGLWYEVGRSV